MEKASYIFRGKVAVASGTWNTQPEAVTPLKANNHYIIPNFTIPIEFSSLAHFILHTE